MEEGGENTGEVPFSFSVADVHSDRIDPEFIKLAKECYAQTVGSRENGVFHALFNACLDRKGPRGYVASFSAKDSVVNPLLMDGEFCGVSATFKIECSDVHVQTLMKNKQQLIKDIVNKLKAQQESPLEDVTSDVECLSDWQSSLARDSTFADMYITRSFSSGFKTTKGHELVVQTNLKKAVRHLIKECKNRPTTLEEFYESEAFKALKHYTSINACRLAHLVSEKLSLQCKTESRRGMHEDFYTVCSPMTENFYNMVYKLHCNEEEEEVGGGEGETRCKYVMYKACFNGKELCLGKRPFVTRKIPKDGFTLWSPSETCNLQLGRAIFDAIPMDIGLVPLEQRRCVNYKPRFNDVFRSMDHDYTAFVVSEESFHAITESEYEQRVDQHGMGSVEQRHLETLLCVVSCVKSKHLPLDYIEKVHEGDDAVAVPMDHKFVHYLQKVYAKKIRKGEDVEIPKLEHLLRQSEGDPSMYVIPWETYRWFKEQIFQKPKYEQKLGRLCF